MRGGGCANRATIGRNPKRVLLSSSGHVHLFFTGTGTNVGKTHAACRWVARLREQGTPAIGLKPISAGDRDDAEKLRAAARDALSLDEINPVHLPSPMAPWAASAILGKAGHEIDFAKLNGSIRTSLARFSHVAVEGVGGWRVPLAEGITVGEWAEELGLPVVIVAPAGLGAINQVLLTLESVERSGLSILGVILNPHGAPPSEALATNRAALARWTGKPVIELTAEGDFPTNGAEWLFGSL